MDYENEDMIFLTYGLRYTPASPGVEPAVGMEAFLPHLKAKPGGLVLPELILQEKLKI